MSKTKVRYKINNRKEYNQALINKDSITFWIDEDAISPWESSSLHGGLGRNNQYFDLSITTALMIKRLFNLSLLAIEDFINSILALMKVSLQHPSYTRLSRRVKDVDVSIKVPIRGEIRHLAIDATGLKVFCKGEWKAKKHGAEKRCLWRKLHLAVDADTHQYNQILINRKAHLYYSCWFRNIVISCVRTRIKNILIALKVPIGQVVLSQPTPYLLNRIKLRRIERQL
ncbi:hypothetical protein BTO01_29165 [Vibrio jasicida]|uniref:IS5 family transposase n=1 Tax=Vibrio jasicida TaxID=766224 RepID=UPI000CF39496|nr:IS5 family transposase [Vibrio jasicida]PQJ44596.1 hypothetical protein BTO01_29165 [Vibrio jasicida]